MYAPQVKPEHRPYLLPDGRIRIGGQAQGSAAEIEDPEGWIWALIQSMDGKHSEQEVVRAIISSFPGLNANDIIQGIKQLTSAGFIEDANAPLNDSLNAKERERYDRSRRYFRFVDTGKPDNDPWHAQVALKNASVTIIGIGGVGSAVALSLAQVGVGKLHIVDFDIIELSNLNRQLLFTEQDIGTPKVEAALKRLQSVNSDITVSASEKRIENAEDINQLTKGATAIVLCADQPADIRDWANVASLASHAILMTCGYHGPALRASIYTPGYGGCFACEAAFENGRLEQFTRTQDLNVERRVTAPVFAPSAQIAGNLGANALIAAITGIPRLPRSYTAQLNLARFDQSATIRTFPRWPTCGACNPLEGK